MARAKGDITLKWGAAGQAVSWASGGPESLASGSWTPLSDEIDLTGLDNVLDVLVSGKAKTIAGSLSSDPYVAIAAAVTGRWHQLPRRHGQLAAHRSAR